MPEKGRTLLLQLREHAVGQAFKSLHEPGRDTVPELGCAEVKVVDTVQIHVFRVPGKGRLPATKVEVGRVDAVDFNTVVLDYIFILIHSG